MNINPTIEYNMLELKTILVIGFLCGFIPNFGDLDFMRIVSSVIGTIVAGTLWVFLKPVVEEVRKKLTRKKIKADE